MPHFTKQAYVNKMLPHLLAIESKKRGIKQTDKTEWRGLAKEIKARLEERYQWASDEELNEDISFNNKGISKRVNRHQFLINDKVVDRLGFISTQKREWIRSNRIELLAKSTDVEQSMVAKITDFGYEVYQKAPFVFSDKIYFAGIFVSSLRLVIELVRKKINISKIYGPLKKRVQAFESHGIRFAMICYDLKTVDSTLKQLLNSFNIK